MMNAMAVTFTALIFTVTVQAKLVPDNPATVPEATLVMAAVTAVVAMTEAATPRLLVTPPLHEAQFQFPWGLVLTSTGSLAQPKKP